MGFVKGKEVTVIKSAPLLDPVEYKIMGYNLSLRKSESNLIEIIQYNEINKREDSRLMMAPIDYHNFNLEKISKKSVKEAYNSLINK